jgi:hypothetical protein
MKELQPPQDPIEAVGQVYERLLEKVLPATDEEEIAARPITDRVREDAVALHELGDDKVVK